MHDPDILSRVILAVLLAAPSLGDASCVNPGGTDGCFSTIQAAVDAASTGEVVNIGAGTYVENVWIGPGRTLTLRGAGPTSTVVQRLEPLIDDESVIDVNGMNTTVTVQDLAVEGSTSERPLISAKNHPVSLFVENCIVTGSSALYGTGAIQGATSVSRSLVQGAQTGIVVNGGCTIQDSVLRGNGNGVMLGGGRGLIAIRRTEISDGAYTGVVSHNGNRAVISDSTISGNVSPGIYLNNRVKLTVERTTIADNGIAMSFCCGTPATPTAGGIWVSDDKVKVKLRASILSNEGDECAARDPSLNVRFRSAGFNVVETASCGDPRSSDSIGSDPLLAALADNGGGSRTHALLPGSPAIGRVTTSCKDRDQRGEPRTNPCDSGALEAP